MSKRIDARPVLREISLNIPPGRTVALIGPNGAGKSTLLKVIAGLMPPTAGRILLFGQPMGRTSAALRARIGLIDHQPMLYRDLTAMENLTFFARLYDVPEPAERARQMLELVGLPDRADDPIKAFSRGMTQRAAIARAMLHDPDLLLADEPFTGLDAASSEMLELLLGRMHTAGKTIVMVHHDVAGALRLAERAVVLRAGRVVVDQPAGQVDVASVLAEVTAR